LQFVDHGVGERRILLAMKYLATALAAAIFAGTVASITIGVAIAEPKAEHVVGEQCVGADIGRKDVAPDGQAIICDSNYQWEPYVGQTPNDPWVTAQNP
jgi:uncharacterized membrane protein